MACFDDIRAGGQRQADFVKMLDAITATCAAEIVAVERRDEIFIIERHRALRDAVDHGGADTRCIRFGERNIADT